MVIRETAAGTDLEIELRGDVPPGVREHARDMMAGLARGTDRQLRHARVRVARHADPPRERPIVAQASLELDGRRIRAQVAAATAREAIDLLADVLRHRMSRLEQHWEARHGRDASAAPHEWRHRDEQAHRPDYLRRPLNERKVVRHKAFEPASGTPDEAIEDLELMAYDFRLFTDAESGQDSVVYRRGLTGYQLAQAKPEPGHAWRSAAPLTTSPYPAPRLSLAEAIERLNMTSWPFVFYADPVTGHGRVLYRRYDGHYGLITPARA